MKCLLTHKYGWPQKGIETCVDCGRTRSCRVEIRVNPRFDIPRYAPRAIRDVARDDIRLHADVEG